MNDLLDLLVRNDEGVPLDVAALQLAMIEFPDLEVAPWIDLIDSYANELSERTHSGDDGTSFIRAANEFLFEELGFRGNGGDYYNPMNSCLNQVLMERMGLPITLSLVYMEIGRRLGRPLWGIGMPGHFLVEYDDGDTQHYIDPFHHGRILEGPECLALASRITGQDMSQNWQALEPVSKRQMALRMLNNMRAAYLRGNSWEKALQVQDLLVKSSSNDATEYRQRGYLHHQMRHYKEAARDLSRYLQLAPEARDRGEIERRLTALHRWVAGMN
ncbi:MAG: transglutaminase family protein [Bryobacterales bacterium]|nr:transglutaminase family protein [Bryobacterales bacterium]